MKKTAVLLLPFLLFSCKKDAIIDIEDVTQKATIDRSNLTTMTTPFFDWENNTDILLPDGTRWVLPWNPGSASIVPTFISEDYKKKDGWELIYNLCETPGQLGQNYLILYNKFTGILRTYYFLGYDVSVGSDGMWGITVNGTNALLNNSGYFAKAMDSQPSSSFAISTNLTDANIAKAIARGWNAFDVEFTYDNSISAASTFSISSFNKNIQDISLSGDLDLTSEGTIITSSTKNSWGDAANAAAKAGGTKAFEYVTKKVGGTDTSGSVIKVGAAVLATIAQHGVSGIISSGLNLIFGSFIGKKNTPETTTQKIEFKTSGKITLSGTAEGSGGNNVVPASNLLVPGTATGGAFPLLPHYNEKLGSWNITNSPKVIIDKRALYAGPYRNDVGLYSSSATIDESSFDVEINPSIIGEIDNYEVETNLYYYNKLNGDSNWIPGYSQPQFVTDYNQLIYDDGDTEIYKDAHHFVALGPIPIPNSDPTQEEDYPSITLTSHPKKYVVKVTVTLYPKSSYNQEPIVITRSYLPTYEFVVIN